jgi:hypothetical protein
MSLTKLSLGTEMSLTFFLTVYAQTEDAEVSFRARGSFFATSPLFRGHPASNLMAWKQAKAASNEKQEGEKQR